MHLETCPGNRNFQQYFRIIFVFKLLVFVFIIGWLSKPRVPYFFNCELYMWFENMCVCVLECRVVQNNWVRTLMLCTLYNDGGNRMGPNPPDSFFPIRFLFCCCCCCWWLALVCLLARSQMAIISFSAFRSHHHRISSGLWFGWMTKFVSCRTYCHLRHRMLMMMMTMMTNYTGPMNLSFRRSTLWWWQGNKRQTSGR